VLVTALSSGFHLKKSSSQIWFTSEATLWSGKPYSRCFLGNYFCLFFKIFKMRNFITVFQFLFIYLGTAHLLTDDLPEGIITFYSFNESANF